MFTNVVAKQPKQPFSSKAGQVRWRCGSYYRDDCSTSGLLAKKMISLLGYDIYTHVIGAETMRDRHNKRN